MVGAAGAGASAAAILASSAGASVTGCDPGGPSPYTPAVASAGIPLAWTHDPGHVEATPHPDRLAVTKALTAIDPDHPELRAARRLGVSLEAWQQVVADAASGRRLVAVAGTHGKSTTSGWLVHVLVAAGADPSAFVGALLPPSVTGGPPATARWGRGEAFVVEADEYAGNFDPFRPWLAVLTTAEWDHPDVFADRASVLGAFETWLRAAAVAVPAPVLVANVGDAGVAELLGRLGDTPFRVIATALVDQAPQRLSGYARAIGERYRTAAGEAAVLLGRIVAADPDGTALEIRGLDPLAGATSTRLATAGRHNAADALTVAGAAQGLGMPAADIAAGLATFSGVGRRLERKGVERDVVVYDDYAHHPTAIRETLAAVRQREPGRRIWAVYEPLTYHRTAALLEEFATVLASADGVAIADIWAGRDRDTSVASSDGLAAAVARRRPDLSVAATGTVEETARWLASAVHPGDAVLVMGGGRSYRIGELLLEALR
ncbi:MAG TPA: cyanophycin synthetase [Candidatus Dormibacteraeota bacterium]|nr:cyanophycin synthetase [Candidatus Dormibacteraeota bacterium]